ncbi:MAG: DUF6614 family protein [Pseudomonadota bacterium]
MILMHGLFDLVDGVTEAEFDQAYDAFSEHLIGSGLMVSSRFMHHQDHDGYNSNPPKTQHYVTAEFVDMQQAQDCWDAIEEYQEPLHELHLAVNEKIHNYRFFLTRDFEPTEDAG